MTDWSKYSKAGNSCTNNLWTVPEWATPADSQASSSQSDLSSQSGASPFDLYKQPGKETPICWETRRLGTENLFGESAPAIRPERPLFQCQIIPGNGNPADLSTLFYATLGGLGIVSAYSRHLRDVLIDGIAYRVYELKERFRNGNELNFQIQVDSSGRTTLIDQASFTDHSKNDKIIRYNIGKPNPSNNWEIEINFGDGNLTQNFVMEYPQGPDKPGRIRLSINQPKQAFVTAGTPFRIVSARFLATETTKAQPAKLVILEYVEPAIPLTGNQGKGSYQIAHLSNGDVATIFIPVDSKNFHLKPSYIHQFPTDRNETASYSPLQYSSTKGRYSPTQPYPFEFAMETRKTGDRTVETFQLMPNFKDSSLLTSLNHSGTITTENANKGIRLQPTAETALYLAHGEDQTLHGEFTGEIFGLTIEANHPLQIQGELQNGVFRPTFPNGQPQQLQAVVYNADGRSFSAPLAVEVHPEGELGYRLAVTYGSGRNGDPGRTIHATPYSNGNLFAITTANQRSRAEQNLAVLATEVGYTLPDQTSGGTTTPVVDLALLQAEMGKRTGNGVARSFFSVTVADTDANITRSDGINFSYHGKIPINSGDSKADFFRVDLGAGKRVELAGILDESGEKFTPLLVRYFATVDGDPRVITTTQTDAGALRLDNFDRLYQSMDIFPAALSHLVHKTGTREEAQANILFRERPFTRPQVQNRPPAPAAPVAPPAPARGPAERVPAATTEPTSNVVAPGVTVADGETRRTAHVVPPAALGTPSSLIPTAGAASGGFFVPGRGGMGALSQARPAPARPATPPPTAEPLMSIAGEAASPKTLPICEPAAPSAPAVPPPAGTPAPITPIVHPSPTCREPEEGSPGRDPQIDEPSEDPPNISEDRPFESAAIRLETIQRVAEEFKIDPATLWDTEAAFPRGMNLRVLSGDGKHRVYGRTGSLLKMEFDLPVHGSVADIIQTLKITYDGQEIPFRYSIHHNRPYILLEGPLQGTVFYFKKPTHSIYNLVEATHPIIREQAERDMGKTPPARPSRNIQFTYPEVRENFLSLPPEERTKFENIMADQIQRNREQVASSKRAEESKPDQQTTGRPVEAVEVSGRTTVEAHSPPSSSQDPIEVLKDFVRRVAGIRNLSISELSAKILAGMTGTPVAETPTESAAPSPALVCEVAPATETQSGVVAEASASTQAAPLVCEGTPPPAVTQSGMVNEPEASDPAATLVCEEAAPAAEARRETPTTFRERLHQEIEQHQRQGRDPIDHSHIQKLLSLVNDRSDDAVLKGWIGAIEETYKHTPETRNIILHKILSLYGRPENNIEERSSIEQLVLAGLDEVFFHKEEQLELLRSPAAKIEREAREAMKTKRVEEAQNAFRKGLREEMAKITESSEHAILDTQIQRAISLIKGHPYDPVLKGWVLAIQEAYQASPQSRNVILREVFSRYAQSETQPEESSVERLVLGGLSKVYKRESTQTENLERLRKDAREREKEAREDMERKIEELARTGI